MLVEDTSNPERKTAFYFLALDGDLFRMKQLSNKRNSLIELVPNLIKFGGGIPIKDSKGQILGSLN